jgi:phosphoglycolate phosphatase
LVVEFGVPPERTLMIGDTTHDLQMAVNANTTNTNTNYSAHEHSAFQPFAPLHVAHNVADLRNQLAHHG